MPDKKQLVFAVSTSTKATLSSLPVSITQTVIAALRAAAEDPSKLAKALYRRMTQQSEENTVRVSTLLDSKVTDLHNLLAHKARLSSEEVTRLALEAYLHRL